MSSADWTTVDRERAWHAWAMAWGAAAVVAVALGLGLAFESYVVLLAALVAIASGTLVVAALVHAPRAGLALLIVVSVLAPLEIPIGVTTVGLPVPLAILLCVTWVIRGMMTSTAAPLQATRAVWAALSLMGAALLSFVTGQYPWFPTPHAPMSAQLAGLVLFLVSGGLFLLVGHDARSIDHVERMTWLFVGAGAVATLLVLVPAPASYYIGLVVKPDSLGSLFWTWLVAVGLSQGLCNATLSAPKRVLLCGVAVLALARGLLVASSWASGWLPPLVAVAVIVFLRFPWLSLAGGLLAAGPALLAGSRVAARVLEGESYSLMTRVQAMEVLWQIIQRNPWVGFGPANYYRYTVLYPILGWYVSFCSHNNYIDLVAQTGLVGLLAFGWFVFEVTLLALRLRARLPRGFARAYVVGVLGGLAGSLVSGFLADWLIPFVYNIGLRGFRSSLLFWLFLGGLYALHRVSPAGQEAVSYAGVGRMAPSPPSIWQGRERAWA